MYMYTRIRVHAQMCLQKGVLHHLSKFGLRWQQIYIMALESYKHAERKVAVLLFFLEGGGGVEGFW